MCIYLITYLYTSIPQNLFHYKDWNIHRKQFLVNKPFNYHNTPVSVCISTKPNPLNYWFKNLKSIDCCTS